MKKFDSINVIPFIDIMLVLLAIVLTTATFVSQGHLDITLPEAGNTSDTNTKEQIEIAIDQAGILYINGGAVSLEKIEQNLSKLDKDTPIVLLIDEATEFRQFVTVVDLLKTFSLNRVSILTRNTR